MQSIDDEIPDLSGPVSLGMYKFTRRGRGRKYETHKLSELQEAHEEESENKVTGSAPTSSAHLPFNPPPPTPLSSSQLLEHSTHQVSAELNNKILNWADKPSPDRRGSHNPSPPQYDKLHPSHYAANLSNPTSSIHTDRPSFQSSGQANPSFPPIQDHRSSQTFSALINPDTPSLQISGQGLPSFSPRYLITNQHSSATFNPAQQSSQPAFGRAANPIPHQDHNSSQTFNVSINTNSPQLSRQAQSSFPPSDRQPDTSQRYSELAKTLKTLIRFDRRDSKAAGQPDLSFPPPIIPPHVIEPYREIQNQVNDLLTTHRQGPQASCQAYHPASPKAYSSPQSLPLSDTLPTATFNLDTNQWDPDLPEANMSAQTPTNKSTRGGHSGQQSSRQSSSRMSHPSQDGRNPYAIVTTTRAGRPYTNPYMPIDPPPSTAGPIARESPSGHMNLNTQHDNPDAVELERKMRYVDQEEARYRALEQAKHGHAEGSLDDPFQDQPTQTQQYGRSQPFDYAEHAVQQPAYGQWPDDGHQPTHTTYASDPSASSFFSDAQQPARIPSTGMTPYRSQRSAYEQQAMVNPRAQKPWISGHEQRSIDPRASVRLPAVRGTMDQQKVLSQEPKFEDLSLDDSTGRSTQTQRHPHTQGSLQPTSGRTSHAVPIRDPAAYTGSGLTTRRNQEALRQNLDTVVASSQGPTGSARTVMNDPHRDRQPERRPSSTVTRSTLRAEATSYEFVTTQHPITTDTAVMKPRPGTGDHHGRPVLKENEPPYLQAHANNVLKSNKRAAADPEVMSLRESSFRAPAVPPGFGQDAAAYNLNAGLPAAAIGAGNAYMKEISKKVPSKGRSKQRLEDTKERLEGAATWFRNDSRDLSYAAEILPRETLHRMSPEQFPLEDPARRTVGHLADDSQDDDPSDRARQAATPRPIGHGRPAGITTPPSNHGPRRSATPTSFSTIAGVSSVDDEEGMARSGRKILKDDAKATEAMFGGVYSNLMTAKNGPYDYTNHYGPPPAYAIDHNTENIDTFLDPQWFATAPPARVGRDPRREQGEYEDPTQGSASRRGDHVRGEVGRRESGGRGGTGLRAWGRV